jgi:septal ring factor EnvC (AmiA/AmiB activator)
MESLEMMRMEMNREIKALEVRVDDADERMLHLDARLKASTSNAEALSTQNQKQFQQLAFLHHAGVGEVRSSSDPWFLLVH